MKLERAIEILEELPYQGEGVLDGKTIAALKLGIEALKRLEKLRGYSMTQVDTRLPGETED